MPFEKIYELKELDFTKQAAFAYLTCERLYPNYLHFSNNFDFGNPSVLRKAIEFLYLNLFESNQDKNKINSLLKEVDKNTPDTEDFTTIFVSSALDACSTVFESLNFLIDNKFQRIKDISTFAIDTAFTYIQNIEELNFNTDKDFQKKINNHPLMIKEIVIQSGIITFICNSKTLDFDDLQTLLYLQESEAHDNLDS